MNRLEAYEDIAEGGAALRPRVAVLIPCYNEAASIAAVVKGFRASLPEACVYVYDNNSSDGTAAIAQEAGAIVRRETRQGKGFVVRRMFADIDADVYVLVDGDDTYDASAAPRLVDLLVKEDCDIVNAARIAANESAFRRGHKFGNRILSTIVSTVFGKRSSDMLSGYKALSRRFVKSFPIKSNGFEIETELLVHGLELDVPIAEIPTDYRERGEGSQSKLRTCRDGLRIIWLITHLVRDEKPLQFFSAVGGFLTFVAIVLATPIFIEFSETGLVPRLPTAVLATGLMLSALLSVTAGLVLDSVARSRRESKLLTYLSMRSPSAGVQ